MRLLLYSLLLCIFSAGCCPVNSDDDLRGVPVTNNPNLLPRTNPTPGQNF